ncbi:hypothetical protein [Amycolatopsis marina]|uniref:hypothetical protein n=1 Tax=Amycolatopsis marina TaxID=490629 RepID=UPI0015A5BC7D|nr:hypothetical protein [Amycolatopsis marina]
MNEAERSRGEHPSEPAEGSRQAGEQAEAKAARRDRDETTGDTDESRNRPGHD